MTKKITRLGDVTTEQRIALALDYYTPKGKQWRVKSKDARAIGSAVFSKIIRKAFIERDVKIVAAGENDPIDPSRIHLDRKAADQLESRLDGVAVRVIAVDNDRSPSADDGEEPSEERKSDDIHRQLGAVLAHALAEGETPMARNPTVGVGGGRAVWYTVEALRRGHQLSWGKVRIVSLSGRVHAKDHARMVSGGLDADLHAMLLEFAFKDPKSLIIGCDITGRGPKHDAKAALASSPIGSEWANNVPDIAIVGVGALLQGHRFFEPDNPGALQPVAKELAELVKLTKKYTDWGRPYCPVGDVANRLFFVPPTGERVPVADQDRIKRLISDVNSRLVNVSDKQLKEIDHLIVVAGSRTKAPALSELLRNSEYKIRSLYTDATTARTLVTLLDEARDTR